jgi:hypothetical protein
MTCHSTCDLVPALARQPDPIIATQENGLAQVRQLPWHANPGNELQVKSQVITQVDTALNVPS